MKLPRFFLLGITMGMLLALAPGLDAFLAAEGRPRRGQEDHALPGGSAMAATLVGVVRAATQQFLDANAAIAMGYFPYPGCVSGPQGDTIRVRYVKDTLVKDGVLAPDQPEALLYEMRKGKLFLVGAEYIVDAAAWDANNRRPPTLFGQVFSYNTSPNRLGLERFYALHVWAWRENPDAVYAEWNPEGSCDEFRGD